jgi:DNA mismatch endonuclease (patch repair protein)
MRDRLTKERRSWNMSRIRGKNTSPELRVRSALHKMGFRFRLHVRIPVPLSLNVRPSTGMKRPLRFVCPDIVLPKYKTAIFVHGCFWHRHRGCDKWWFSA